jgi:hypothetical protein
MKRILVVGLVICLSLVLATSVFAAKHKKAPAEKAGTKPSASVFKGTVTAVNGESKMMTVKGKDSTISFDVSKPVFHGYKTLGDVKQGDTVSVAYGSSDTKITKVSAAKPAKAKQPAAKGKKPAQTKKKPAPK